MPPTLGYSVRRSLCQYVAVCATAAFAALGFVACGGRQAETPPRTVTFNKDVAPILFKECTPCHRPGQMAPFGLLTYNDARSRSVRIANSIVNRTMPPWLPEPGYGEFANERSLTREQIATIDRWMASGLEEGDSAEKPAPPLFNESWQLGKPDLVLELPQPYTLKPGSSDVFRNFVIPVTTTTRRYVRGLEFHPGARNVIHHAVVGVDRTRASRRLDAADPEPGYEGMFADGFENPDGFFVGWTPGRAPAFEPFDLAWPLDPGVDLVVQMHLLPGAEAVTVAPQIGLFFTDTPPSRPPSLLKLGTTAIDIAPNESDHAEADQFELPVECEVLSIYPHAHYLAKEMDVSAKLPDGSTRWLLKINRWDFMWQDVYRLRTPMTLPRGTVLQMRFTYDNSDANPKNPQHPPVRVRYGPRSSDEMGDLYLQVRTSTREDAATLGRAQAAHRQALALRGAEHMVESDPKDAGARNALGAEYLRAGRIPDAVAQLREAIARNPRYAEAFNNLGLAEQASGRLPEAIRAFRQAATIKPNDDAVRLNLGNALNAAGQTDEAMSEWQRALTINPESADAHNNLGMALGSRKRIAEAIAHFERALAVDPAHADAHNNLAIALGAQGRFDEAIAHVRTALALRPDNADARTNLDVLMKLKAGTAR